MAEVPKRERAENEPYPPSIEKITDIGGVRKYSESLVRVPPQLADLRNILPFVNKGWSYRTDCQGRLSYLLDTRIQRTDAQTIKLFKGGSHVRLPLPYSSVKYPQWLTGVSVFFSNPNAVLQTKFGDYQLSVSPLTYDAFFKSNYFFNVAMKCVGASPLTAYGPMYTLAFDPPDAIPCPPDFHLEVYVCPETCIADEVEVLAWIVSRVIITDRDEFLNSLQKSGAEFLVGKELKNWVSNG